MLPGPTYVRGFLRTYSDHLGLDGRLVVEQYESQFERPREQSAHEEHLRRNRSRRRSREGRILAIVAVLVLTCAVGVWIVTASTGTGTASETTPSENQHTSLELRFLTQSQDIELHVHKESETGSPIIDPVRLVPNRPEELTVAPPVWIRMSMPNHVTLSVNKAPVTIPTGATAFRVVGEGRIEVDP